MKASELILSLIIMASRHGDLPIDCISPFDEETNFVNSPKEIKFDGEKGVLIIMSDM